MIQVPPGESLLAGGRTWPLWFAGIAVIAGVLALFSIWTSHAYSFRAKVVWTVIVLALPIIGALGWFVLGRSGGSR